MLSLDQILLEMMERGASDLHITVGAPPIIRVNGELMPLDYPKLMPQDTKEMIYGILTQEQREKLEKNLEFDFS